MGNLNVHVDYSADRFTMRLNDIMSMYGLKQQVSFSTHREGLKDTHLISSLLQKTSRSNQSDYMTSDRCLTTSA